MIFWFWNPIPHVSWGYNKGIYVITVQGERRRQVYLDYAEPQPVICNKMLWRVCFVPTLHKGTTRSLLIALENVGLLWITCLLWVCLLVSVCFGLRESGLLEKWAETRQAHYSAFCVAPGNWLLLLFTMYLLFSKSVANLIFFHEIPSTSNVFLSQSVIFSCFYRFLWLNMQRSNPCLNRNLNFFVYVYDSIEAKATLHLSPIYAFSRMPYSIFHTNE